MNLCDTNTILVYDNHNIVLKQTITILTYIKILKPKNMTHYIIIKNNIDPLNYIQFVNKSEDKIYQQKMLFFNTNRLKNSSVIAMQRLLNEEQ